jgi:RNA polymerase sigma-70 factor, ECF subfamily
MNKLGLMSMNQNTPSGEADFMRLFLHHQNAFRAFARSLLQDWTSVDDVLQEASVVMWQKMNQLENEGGFLPWGKVIIRFKCLNYLQKQNFKKQVFSEKLLNLLADEAVNIDKDEHAGREKALEKCLMKFSPAQREFILAPYINHGSIKQMADTQKTTVNSLYKKLGRLRNKLFMCIRGQIEEGA